MFWLIGFVMIAFGVAVRVGARDSFRGQLVTVVCLLLAAGLWGLTRMAPLYDNDAMLVGLTAVGMSCIAAGAVAGELYLLCARKSD